MLAFVAGLALGMVAHNASLARALEPIGALWVNAVRMPALPLIVGLLITSVASMPDSRRIGALTIRTVAVVLALLVLFVALTTLVTPTLLSRLALDPASTATLRASARIDLAVAEGLTFKGWLLSLIPTNPIKAGAEGLFLPTVIVSLLYALAVSRLEPESRQLQIRFFQGLTGAMLTIVRWVVLVAPIGVFALAVVLGTQLGGSAVRAVAYYLTLLMALLAAGGIALYAITLTFGRIGPRAFFTALLPAQAVAISSRSSFAALPLLIEQARSRLRLPEPVVGYALPLAAGIYKFGAAISWPVGALFVAHLSGVSLAPTQLVTFAIGTVLLSISTPGIPSGGFLVQAPLWAAVGLPVEGLGILIAVDAVPDMFKGALNVAGYLSAATLAAGSQPGDAGPSVGS